MKKLLDLGGEAKTEMLVWTKSKSTVYRGVKPFVPHYGEFTVFPLPQKRQFVTWIVELKDGSTHAYYYGTDDWSDYAFDAASICNGVQNRDYTVDFGGEFFNPNVRPLLVSKDKSPV